MLGLKPGPLEEPPHPRPRAALSPVLRKSRGGAGAIPSWQVEGDCQQPFLPSSCGAQGWDLGCLS